LQYTAYEHRQLRFLILEIFCIGGFGDWGIRYFLLLKPIESGGIIGKIGDYRWQIADYRNRPL